MASKISLIFLAVAVVLHMMSWETQATIVRRDAPAVKPDAPAVKPEKNAAESLDEAFQSFKSGINNFVKKIEDNEFVQNITAGIKTFSEKVQKNTEEFVSKLKPDASKKGTD